MIINSSEFENLKKDGFILAPIKIKDENFINSDNIASKYLIGDLAAGRKTIEKIKELIGKDEDFAIETTFSGKTLSKSTKKHYSFTHHFFVFLTITFIGCLDFFSEKMGNV